MLVLQAPQRFYISDQLLEGSVLRKRLVKLMVYIALWTHWTTCVMYLAHARGHRSVSESAPRARSSSVSGHGSSFYQLVLIHVLVCLFMYLCLLLLI